MAKARQKESTKNRCNAKKRRKKKRFNIFLAARFLFAFLFNSYFWNCAMLIEGDIRTNSVQDVPYSCFQLADCCARAIFSLPPRSSTLTYSRAQHLLSGPCTQNKNPPIARRKWMKNINNKKVQKKTMVYLPTKRETWILVLYGSHLISHILQWHCSGVSMSNYGLRCYWWHVWIRLAIMNLMSNDYFVFVSVFRTENRIFCYFFFIVFKFT